MPPVPGFREILYAFPDTDDFMELEKQWADGDFVARALGRLVFESLPDKPVVLYLNVSRDPQIVGQILAMKSDPRARAFQSDTVEWRKPTRPAA
ncbi:MAG TPA: hypothetical protein VLG47_01510 [Candidatus Saccharimonadales bacterium]|nr:hypothetical protein [Candidatus Saccharimonadales bacterium]